jgi:hypothetical protein
MARLLLGAAISVTERKTAVSHPADMSSVALLTPRKPGHPLAGFPPKSVS